MLINIKATQWDGDFSNFVQAQAIQNLEAGKILYLPELPFELFAEEKFFLSTAYLNPGAKNISYVAKLNQLSGIRNLEEEKFQQLKQMLRRFFASAKYLVHSLFPHYADKLWDGRTSYRPAEIMGRKTSYRKDDTRLHVDAFPSSPNQGSRILRVFCNINPHEADRIWRVGEPFEKVAEQFLPKCSKPIRGVSALLQKLRITKTYRTPYDHYMLQIHNQMKADMNYQRKASQQCIHFPPGSTWIVQTDQVSHAAMQGQYVLEQTFYLPIEGMKTEAQSPLRVLERLVNCALV